LQLRLRYEKGWCETIKAIAVQIETQPHCLSCVSPKDYDCVEINGFRFLFSDFICDRKFIAKVCQYYNNILGNCYVSIKLKSERYDNALHYTTGIFSCPGDYIVISISPQR